MFTGIGLIAFGCIFGAASFGLFLGHCLGDERRSDLTRRALQKLMIFAPLNARVAAMLISSFSVAVAVNLLLDMEQPFAGFIRASEAPTRQALDEMK
jgi:hypothetical protein